MIATTKRAIATSRPIAAITVAKSTTWASPPWGLARRALLLQLGKIIHDSP